MFNGIGGPIGKISMKGQLYSVPKDVEATIVLGGLTNTEVEMNGDGTGRLIKDLLPWSAEGLSVNCDAASGDLENLNQLAALPSGFAVTIELVDGTVLQGYGQIIGNLGYSSQKSTASFVLKGAGKLTRQ